MEMVLRVLRWTGGSSMGRGDSEGSAVDMVAAIFVLGVRREGDCQV